MAGVLGDEVILAIVNGKTSHLFVSYFTWSMLSCGLSLWDGITSVLSIKVATTVRLIVYKEIPAEELS